ncbi:hypothetical protein F5Y17DRAFT_432940 [Xylariaceae sp. FL0594]|nr:hypothetical protein F5Y17DRAFT_432940 [Xylariaceae sp. FL0594]
MHLRKIHSAVKEYFDQPEIMPPALEQIHVGREDVYFNYDKHMDVQVVRKGSALSRNYGAILITVTRPTPEKNDWKNIHDKIKAEGLDTLYNNGHRFGFRFIDANQKNRDAYFPGNAAWQNEDGSFTFVDLESTCTKMSLFVESGLWRTVEKIMMEKIKEKTDAIAEEMTVALNSALADNSGHVEDSKKPHGQVTSHFKS